MTADANPPNSNKAKIFLPTRNPDLLVKNNSSEKNTKLKEGAKIATFNVLKPKLFSRVQKTPLLPQKIADNMAKIKPMPL